MRWSPRRRPCPHCGYGQGQLLEEHTPEESVTEPVAALEYIAEMRRRHLGLEERDAPNLWRDN